MRILFATTRGAGHAGPLLPLAHASRRAGHDVLLAGPPPVAALADRAGLPFRPVGEPPAAVAEAHWAPVFSPTGAPGADYVVRDLFAGLQGSAALPGMLAAIEEWDADVVVRETMEFASCVAAERLGVPEVQFGIHLWSGWDAAALPFAAPALAPLRAAAGLPPDGPAGGPILTMAPASLSADAPADGIRRFRDPATLPPAPADAGEPPLVYVSFGSEAPRTEYFPALYRGAAEALAPLPVRVLLTIGDAPDPAALGPLPASVRVERWVPQAAVMPRAAAIVGHGGSGSTLAALAAGVPSVLLPLFADGAGNAARVAERGAGIALEGGLDALPGLADAVRRVLEEPRHRRAAADVADEIRALPPIDDAVDALTEVAAVRAQA